MRHHIAVRIGELSGIARPSDALRGRLGLLRVPGTYPLEVLANDVVAIDALAEVVGRAIMVKARSSDGRIDMTLAADYIISVQELAQKESSPYIARLAQKGALMARARAVERLRDVLDQALFYGQTGAGEVDLKITAAYILKVMREP